LNSHRHYLFTFAFCYALLFTAGSFAAEAPVGQQCEAFSLRDYRGKTYNLAEVKEPVVVIAFIGVECPLAKLYTERLNEIAANYADQGVTVLGVDANVQDSITEIAAFARRQKIAFPILKDVGNRVADQLGAVRTPEVFLLDKNRVVQYWGRIDDQYGIGYLRDEPTRHDLTIALDELLAEKPISKPVAASSGCHIGRVRTPDPKATVTYTNQISRILQKNCVECHREGEIAPFALNDYDEVVGWAEMIAEVVDEERMPPWHASEKHGNFANDRRLSQEEKQLIFDWVDAGAPQGDLKDLPTPLEYTTGWQLPREPDLVVDMRKVPYTVPATGTVAYQYFTSDYEFKEDRWISGVEVMPGNRAVVHHILVFVKIGRKRFGEGDGFLAAFVPGLRANPFPEGMAKRVPAGAKLYFQVHYTPIGSEQVDMSKVGFLFTEKEKVEYEVRTASASNRRFTIPPGASNHRLEATSGSVGHEVLLLSMMPHMHLRGKSFRMETVPPTKSEGEVLLDVPQYDFNWQTSYRLTEPKRLPAGARIHCIAHYDNSEDNLANPDPTDSVHFGPQTWHEMLFGYFDYAVKLSDDVADTEAVSRAEAMLRQLDKDKDGFISRSETPARYMPQFNRLDTNRDDCVSLEELTRS